LFSSFLFWLNGSILWQLNISFLYS
jgi:hypothetical protein